MHSIQEATKNEDDVTYAKKTVPAHSYPYVLYYDDSVKR